MPIPHSPAAPNLIPTPGDSWRTGTKLDAGVLRTNMYTAARHYKNMNPGIDPADVANAMWNRLTTEGTINRKTGACVVPGSSWSNATGIGQFLPSFVEDYNRATGSNISHEDIQNGRVSPSVQTDIAVRGFAQFMNICRKQFPQIKDPGNICTMTALAYNIGTNDKKGLGKVARMLGEEPSDANFAAFKAAADAECAIQNRPPGTNAVDGAPRISQWLQTPIGSSAATLKPLAPDLTGVVPLVQPPAIMDGLDSVPWWELEGALIGNRRLGAVPDAVSFKIHLRRDRGDLLRDSQGRPIVVRLNVGLKTLGFGSSHQNTVEPTGTGLLVNLWEAKPDMVTATGTTGVFMNQGGLTAIMSSKESAETLQFVDALKMAYRDDANYTKVVQPKANGFRVIAQDAFAELLALFKNNGIIRYLPRDLLYGTGVPDLKSEQATTAGLTGYQTRHRVGDVMSAGYVSMSYKGRTMLGYFKQFEWSASAESPYRWDFSFTFRVLSDYIPYYMRV